MSRVGKLPVEIPQGVKVLLTGSSVTVEGPKGTLAQNLRTEIDVKLEDNTVTVSRKNDSKMARSFHGLYRNLIFNMVKGVSEGFSKTLIINGVGYRAEVKGRILVLNLGYSNPVEYYIEDGINIVCESPTKVIVSGINKERVGQVSAEIRSIRGPEPYKGKGIKYDYEKIRRKIGKSGVK